MDGKPHFGLALECWLSSRLRSFPRRPLYARLPPNWGVRGRGPLCPQYVDSSRPDRAHTGHSSTAWRQGLIDLSWRRQRGPQGQPSPLKGTSRFRTRPALITRRCHCGERDRTHSRLFETLTHFAACLGDSSRTFVGRHPGLVLYRRAGRLPKVTEATARFIRPAGQAAAR